MKVFFSITFSLYQKILLCQIYFRYANQLTRSGFPAMQRAARSILEHHRAKECDQLCISIKEIINLIPED